MKQISTKKLSNTGFLLMVLGPLLVALLGRIPWTLPELITTVIGLIAIVLPGVGAVLSIISVVRCKKTKEPVHTLSIVTIVMCNPLFYCIYFFSCAIAGNMYALIPDM